MCVCHMYICKMCMCVVSMHIPCCVKSLCLFWGWHCLLPRHAIWFWGDCLGYANQSHPDSKLVSYLAVSGNPQHQRIDFLQHILGNKNCCIWYNMYICISFWGLRFGFIVMFTVAIPSVACAQMQKKGADDAFSVEYACRMLHVVSCNRHPASHIVH